jgi:prophage regulatory protein
MLQNILRMAQLKAATGKSRSEIYDDIKQGKFPRPVRLSRGGKAVGWLETEILEWQRNRIAERDAIDAS